MMYFLGSNDTAAIWREPNSTNLQCSRTNALELGGRRNSILLQTSPPMLPVILRVLHLSILIFMYLVKVLTMLLTCYNVSNV